MIDKITSVFDNYNGKIKNPFIGTIISVWLIHNWRIPYALFNFDKECTLQDKINFIADYFGKKNLWLELINVIGFSFLVLIFTFILMAFSRAITDFYYKIVEPSMTIKIDKNAIFTKEDKLILENKIIGLEDSLNLKREEIIKAENNISVLTTRRNELQSVHDAHVYNSTEELKKITNNYTLLENKSTVVFKIINRYDDIYKSLAAHEKNEIDKLSVDHELIDNRIYISQPTLELLHKNGFVLTDKGKYSLNINGRLFLDYVTTLQLQF